LLFSLSEFAHAGGLKICLLFVVLILVCLWFTKKRKAARRARCAAGRLWFAR